MIRRLLMRFRNPKPGAIQALGDCSLRLTQEWERQGVVAMVVVAKDDEIGVYGDFLPAATGSALLKRAADIYSANGSLPSRH